MVACEDGISKFLGYVLVDNQTNVAECSHINTKIMQWSHNTRFFSLAIIVWSLEHNSRCYCGDFGSRGM